MRLWFVPFSAWNSNDDTTSLIAWNSFDCDHTRLSVCCAFIQTLRIWIMKARKKNTHTHNAYEMRKRSYAFFVLDFRFFCFFFCIWWVSALAAASVISMLIRLFKILGFFSASIRWSCLYGIKRNWWNEVKINKITRNWRKKFYNTNNTTTNNNKWS